jgi:hypothetical protein
MKCVLGTLLMVLLVVQKILKNTVLKYAEAVSFFVKETRPARSVDVL